MDQQAVIADFERRVRAAGVSVSAVCARANVHPTTFSRWKKTARNPEPIGATFKSIEKLEEALRDITAARRQQARRAVRA